MSLVTVSTLSTITVAYILHEDNPHESTHYFYLVSPEGEKTAFHWLSEPSRDERDGSELAIQRMAAALGIRYEYDEIYGDDDDK